MTLDFKLRADWPDGLLSSPPRTAPHARHTQRYPLFAPEAHHVYRIDLMSSDFRYLPKRILTEGHRYANPLGNLRQHTRHDLPHVAEAATLLDRIGAQGSVPRGLYLWDNFNLARHFQLSMIANSHALHMNARRKIRKATRGMAEIPLISRVWRNHLPAGTFVSDLNPQFTPYGLAHIVGVQPDQRVVIPHFRIEFYFNGEWINIRRIDFTQLEGDANGGSLESIVPPVDRLLISQPSQSARIGDEF